MKNEVQQAGDRKKGESVRGRAKKGRTKAIIKRKGKGNKDGEVNLGKVRKERWRERIQ